MKNSSQAAHGSTVPGSTVVSLEKKDSWPVAMFLLLIKSCNPKNYTHFLSSSQKHAWKNYYHMLLFCFLVMLVFSLPLLFQVPAKLSTEIQKLNLQISPDLFVEQPITFNRADIVITNEQEYRGENLLITNSSISVAPFRCFFVHSICLFKHSPYQVTDTNAAEIFDTHKKEVSSALAFMMLLMIPGVLLLLFAYYFVKYAALILIVTFFEFVLVRTKDLQLSASQTLLIGIYASFGMIALEIIILPYFSLSYLPLLWYIILFTWCVLRLGHKRALGTK